MPDATFGISWNTHKKVKLEPFGQYLRVFSMARKQTNGIVRSLHVEKNRRYQIALTAYKQCVTKVRFAVFDEKMRELDLIDYPEVHLQKTMITYVLTSEVSRDYYFGVIFDQGKIDDAFVIEQYELTYTNIKSEQEKLGAMLKFEERFKIFDDADEELPPVSTIERLTDDRDPEQGPPPRPPPPRIVDENLRNEIITTLMQIKTAPLILPDNTPQHQREPQLLDTSNIVSLHNVLSDKYRPIYKTRLAHIRESRLKQVVELGCNDGLFASELCRTNFHITSYHGYDYNPTAIILARQRFVDSYAGKVFKFSIRNLDTAAPAGGAPVIFLAFQIFEHMYNDLEYISQMPPGSLVLFSLPNYKCNGCFREYKSDADIRQRYDYFLDIKSIEWHYMEGHPMFECVAWRRGPTKK